MPELSKSWVAAALVVCSFAGIARGAEESALESLRTESGSGADHAVAAPNVEPASRASTGSLTTATRRVTIEEIVVTAQKREENVQDVPISIQAFSGDELEARGVLDPQDLQRVTPGLVYDELAGFSIVYLRGVGTDGFLPGGDLSVASYVDGVYFSGAHGLARELDAVERVEVLKGPQGTLFGRNSTGGAINIVTREPTEELTATVSGTLGNFNERRVKLFVSGPLPWGFAMSAAGIVGARREYYDVASDSPVRSLPDEEQKGVRAKLRWAPVDFFEATAAALFLDTDSTGTVLNANQKPSLLSNVLGIEAADDEYEVAVSVPPYLSTRTRVGYLTLGLHPPWFDVKSITAYQNIANQAQYDYDGGAEPIVSFDVSNPLFGEDFTQELQILSNEDSPLADWVEWIAGFYYIRSRTGFSKLDVTVGGLEQPKIRLFGRLTTESPAGFFQATLAPLDWMDVTFGGRYQTEQREISGSRSMLLFSDGSTTTFFAFRDRTRNDSNFSPKAVLALRPVDWLNLGIVEDLMTYFSWTKGFKSGTYNVLNITEEGDEVRSEEVTTHEVGLKSELFGGKLRANGSVFRNEIADLQSQFISLLSGGTTNYENAGEASIEGAEIDLTLAILPDLIFNLTGTYLDGVYDDFRDASGYDPSTGLFSQSAVDNTGNTIVRTPEYAVNAGLVYAFDLWDGVVEAATDVYYNDGYFYDTQNLERQDAYYMTNARLGYLYAPWNLRVTAYGQNMNGAKRFLYKFVQDFGVVGKLGPPATFGVRFDWEF